MSSLLLERAQSCMGESEGDGDSDGDGVGTYDS